MNSTCTHHTLSFDSPPLCFFNDYLSHNVHTLKLLEPCGLNDALWLLSPDKSSMSISSHLFIPILYIPVFLVSLTLISSSSCSLVSIFLFSLHSQLSCIPTYHFFLLKTAMPNNRHCLTMHEQGDVRCGQSYIQWSAVPTSAVRRVSLPGSHPVSSESTKLNSFVTCFVWSTFSETDQFGGV